MTRPASDPWRIERLVARHRRARFASGVAQLDAYLRERASQEQRRRVTVTYVATAHHDLEVAGFYTLAARSVPLFDLPDDVRRRLPRYDAIPATLIGRLAVHEGHRGRYLGETLLVDALARSLQQSERVASWAVVVDAYDERAAGFYRRYGFQPFSDRPGRLLLPMATVAKLPWVS